VTPEPRRAQGRLLIATSNRDKLQEIHSVLAGTPVELLTLADLPPVEEPDETGATFAENARLKALHYADMAARSIKDPELLTIAEDSGLVVDALDGQPGVRSARFLRPDASYAERFDEIYRRLSSRPAAPRTARFVCALAAVRGRDVVFETTGVIEGEISAVPRGTHGFGYDPIFVYPPYGRTLAEVDGEDKLRVAHRGHAFRSLRAWLQSNGSS
jgi:XTP/dITP diphosphohydrolase